MTRVLQHSRLWVFFLVEMISWLFAFYGFVKLLRKAHIIQILLMKSGQKAIRILINCILYFVFFMLLNEFLSTILSADAFDEASSIGSLSSDNKTCWKRLDQRLVSLEIATKPQTFRCPKAGCNLTSFNNKKQMMTQFQQCAKTACWKEIPGNYLIEVKIGVLYKDKYFNFICFTFQKDQDQMIIINDKLKKSFKENCLELFVDFICRLVGSQAPAKLKSILVIKDWPFVPMILSAIALYLFFGPAYDKLKEYTSSFQKKQEKDVEISHAQKVEDGHKIIEYLYGLQQEKMPRQKWFIRRDVPEAEVFFKFLQHSNNSKVKIVTANQGIGFQSAIEYWVKRRINAGVNIIYYNLNDQIDCYTRLGVKDGLFSYVDCILEAIIFEKDRNIASVIFTSVTMAAHAIFNLFIELVTYEFIKVFAILLMMCILTFIQEPLAYYFSQLPIIQWIHAYGLIFLGFVAVSILIVYLLISVYQLQVDPQFLEQVQSRFLDKDCKKIVIINNIQMVYPDLEGKQGRDIVKFLVKCQHAQNLRNWDIILVSSSTNFTKIILNKEDYLLNDVKYDDYNFSRLSFESVRRIVDFRMSDKDGGAVAKKFGNILTYFIDNAQILFQVMRKLRMDKKYNRAEFLFKDFDNPSIYKLIKFKEEQKKKPNREQQKKQKIELEKDLSQEQIKSSTLDLQISKLQETFKQVKQQINELLQGARVRLIKILDSSAYASYMLKYHHNFDQKSEKQNKQKQYKKEFQDCHNVFLNLIIDAVILKMPFIQENYRPSLYMFKRYKYLMGTQIKDKDFQKLLDACKDSFGQAIQIEVKEVLKGNILTFPFEVNQMTQENQLIERNQPDQTIKDSRKNQEIEQGQQIQENIDFKNHLIIKFLYKWYKSQQNKPNQTQYEFLIQRFHPYKKSIRNIVSYLNYAKVFYFYNFSSSVNALAYFMIVAKIDKIDFDIAQLFESML